MGAESRIIIIGLDGVPYRLLKDLCDRGKMPNVKTLVESGQFRKMETTIPEISSIAWSSMITGANAAEHGIFGFCDFPKGTYRLTFPNYSNLKAMPFWQKDPDNKAVIVNVPQTFPAKKLNGVHVSGFVSLDLDRATYPKDLLPVLQNIDYRIDVDNAKAHKSMELFLSDLDRTLDARIKFLRYIWDAVDWKYFMFVFTGTDRLSHFLWSAYEDEDHIYHSDFLKHYEKIDVAIGEIISKMGSDDSLLMLSDHGFERLDTEVYINAYLERNGFLNLKDDKRLGISGIDKGTKAFALDPSRIYLNTKDYPNGNVDDCDKAALLSDLENVFTDLTYNDKPVIKKVYRKEDVFYGPFLNQAPDLVLLPNEGFDLKARVGGNGIFDRGLFTGKHTQHDAFLLLNTQTSGHVLPETPKIYDVAGVIDILNGMTN